MRERWLREITDITGVEGVILVASNGKIIESIRTKPDLRIIESVSRNILRMISANQSAGMEIREVELAWQDYRILAMSTNTFVIIIFCNSIKVLSLLRITMSVVAAHLMEDKKTMKKIKKSARDSVHLLDENDLDESERILISKLQ